MTIYNSFNEMAEGTGALETGCRMSFVDNMSPKFVSIPPFHGKQFFVRAHEEAHGGKPEKPHVHLSLPEGDIKCWISEGPGRNQVELHTTTIPKTKIHMVAEVIEHLQENWEDAGREWNNFIDENYPNFSNDEQCKVPIP